MAFDAAMTRLELLTLIDFCDQMATRIRADWTDPRRECRAIWDAHDMAHVIHGEDRVRTWQDMEAVLALPDDEGGFGEAWPDVRRRTYDLLCRLREVPHAKRGD
ncbi:MAG: hypothetical protein HY873_13305 [Chloroflexi bacterium]|nr:hypothetical protein [Chloroflexota bacterium]